MIVFVCFLKGTFNCIASMVVPGNRDLGRG